MCVPIWALKLISKFLHYFDEDAILFLSLFSDNDRAKNERCHSESGGLQKEQREEQNKGGHTHLHTPIHTNTTHTWVRPTDWGISLSPKEEETGTDRTQLAAACHNFGPLSVYLQFMCMWECVCRVCDTCPPAQLIYWISARLTSGDVAGRRQGPLWGSTA